TALRNPDRQECVTFAAGCLRPGKALLRRILQHHGRLKIARCTANRDLDDITRVADEMPRIDGSGLDRSLYCLTVSDVSTLGSHHAKCDGEEHEKQSSSNRPSIDSDVAHNFSQVKNVDS